MPVNDARQLAARWLATAEGDLIIARAAGRDDDAPPRGAAFFVQQALEKALKSILAWEQIDFPRVHDLDRLAGMLPMSWELAIPVGELARITDYGVEARYPSGGDEHSPPVTSAEVDDALALVEDLVARIAAGLVARGLTRAVKPE